MLNQLMKQYYGCASLTRSRLDEMVVAILLHTFLINQKIKAKIKYPKSHRVWVIHHES